MTGSVDLTSTVLTQTLSDSGDVVTVAGTEGFPAPGVIVIGAERIWYSSTDTTHFTGNFARPLVRGADGTDNVTHLAGSGVRTPTTSILNNALDYDIALLTDTSGIMAFVVMPLALLDLLKSFIFLPIGFLGTDLQFLTVIWAIVVLGVIVAIIVAMSGGRRV